MRKVTDLKLFLRAIMFSLLDRQKKTINVNPSLDQLVMVSHE